MVSCKHLHVFVAGLIYGKIKGLHQKAIRGVVMQAINSAGCFGPVSFPDSIGISDAHKNDRIHQTLAHKTGKATLSVSATNNLTNSENIYIWCDPPNKAPYLAVHSANIILTANIMPTIQIESAHAHTCGVCLIIVATQAFPFLLAALWHGGLSLQGITRRENRTGEREVFKRHDLTSYRYACFCCEGVFLRAELISRYVGLGGKIKEKMSIPELITPFIFKWILILASSVCNQIV